MAMPSVGIIASSDGKQPDAPTIGTATGGNASASVAFTASVYKGKNNTISTYTATSSPGGNTGTSATSPITVSSLTNGTAYTFTVTATANYGTGIDVLSLASAASNSVTPFSATLRRCTSFQISIACCTNTSQCGALGAGATCSPANGFFDPDAC
jgi:hypothetical protein